MMSLLVGIRCSKLNKIPLDAAPTISRQGLNNIELTIFLVGAGLKTKTQLQSTYYLGGNKKSLLNISSLRQDQLLMN